MDQYKYADGQKTSVKVHHQPGGASQWSFGWANDDGSAQNNKISQSKPPMSNQNQPQRQAKQESYPPPQYQQNLQSRPPIHSQPNQYQYQQQQSMQMPHNQPQVFGQRADSNDRTSVKVHAPPGGKASLNIFGGYDDIPNQRASPSRLKPQPKEVQYKIGSQYQVAQEQKQFGNGYGPTTSNQQSWQQPVVQNQHQYGRGGTQPQRYDSYGPQSEVTKPDVLWPSRVNESQDAMFRNNNQGGYRQPSPQRMAGQNRNQVGYVPSQFENQPSNGFGGVRKSQAVLQSNYSYENMAPQNNYQQQQSDQNFSGLKSLHPPGGRSQIVLN